MLDRGYYRSEESLGARFDTRSLRMSHCACHSLRRAFSIYVAVAAACAKRNRSSEGMFFRGLGFSGLRPHFPGEPGFTFGFTFWKKGLPLGLPFGFTLFLGLRLGLPFFWVYLLGGFTFWVYLSNHTPYRLLVRHDYLPIRRFFSTAPHRYFFNKSAIFYPHYCHLSAIFFDRERDAKTARFRVRV